MSLLAFEHPILSGLTGDPDIAGLFSADAELAAMLAFEVELAAAEAQAGVIPNEAAAAIRAALSAFRPDMAALRAATAIDGVVVPDLVRQMRRAVGGSAASFVHYGATSQDVIDTGLMLRLKQAAARLAARLGDLDQTFAGLEARDGDRPLMAYTRMQAAIPITAGDRIRSWRQPLQRSARALDDFYDTGFAVQFGGAAGTLDRLGTAAGSVRAELARRLSLVDEPQWQSQRSRLAEFAGLLSLVTGSLGKVGQDLALLAQMGNEIELAGGGGSSAMPHKRNPVKAELLITLARFNAVQLSGMHHALVHEQERSGAAWMLEWLLLPPMVAATGNALLTASDLVKTIGFVPSP